MELQTCLYRVDITLFLDQQILHQDLIELGRNKNKKGTQNTPNPRHPYI